MHGQVHPASAGWATYAIPVTIFIIVMAVRLRAMRRTRPLKIGGLWIVPAIYLALTVFMFVALPPSAPVALASLVTVAIGAVFGWQRGKMMHIDVDPQTDALNQKASPAAILFLLALVVVRAGARSIVGERGGINPAMLTDPLVAFALGMFSMTRLEMYLRAKRLLEEARARR